MPYRRIGFLSSTFRCVCRNLTTENNAQVLRHNNQYQQTVGSPSRRLSLLTSENCLNHPQHESQVRLFSRSSNRQASVEEFEISTWRQIKHTFGFTGDLKYPFKVLSLAGYRTYLCCSQVVDYNEFVEVLHLPDTFNTWYLVTELHIWMVMTRLVFEGVEGRYCRNQMVKSLWVDAGNRARKMGHAVTYTDRLEKMGILKHHLFHSMAAYDEGFLSDDRKLAGALWDMLFEREDVDARTMETMIEYVRKQLQSIHNMESTNLLANGIIGFPSLKTGNLSKEKKDLIKSYFDPMLVISKG